MKELLNILIPMLVSCAISLILYIITKRKILAVIICLILILFSLLGIYFINMPKLSQFSNNNQIENEDVLSKIKINYTIGKYEEMFQLARDYNLMENEEMLNCIGIMYSQGIYFDRDYEKAISYLNAAAMYGESENTFNNLWLISYMADREELNDNDISYTNSIAALAICEKHNIDSINNMLRFGVSAVFDEEIENGYVYIKSLSDDDKKKLFDAYYLKCETLNWLICTEYAYGKDVYKNENTGEIVEDIFAVPCKLEERQIPVYIFIHMCPQTLILFDDISLHPSLASNFIITGQFEYEATYIDENGKSCFWRDTDKRYHGNTPPGTDGNTRWVITKAGETYEEREYKLQIKDN